MPTGLPPLNALRAFEATARHLSFKNAAEELFVTPAALSHQIKALEEDLGVQLFDRAGAHIQLTEAGRVLLGYSQQVKSLLVQAETEITALNGEHAGQLALGASTTIAQYLLPRLLGEFRREYPRVYPTLVSGNTEQIVEGIEKQKIVLGFIEGPARSREVRTDPFLDDELVLIASTAHEWAERSSVSCSELVAVPFLMRERGSGTRHVTEHALELHGVKRSSLRIVMELDSTEAIKSAVEAGLGIGFVSLWAIAKDLRLDKSFRIIEVEGLRIKREFLVAYPSGPEPTGLASEFRRFVLARAGMQRTLIVARKT